MVSPQPLRPIEADPTSGGAGALRLPAGRPLALEAVYRHDAFLEQALAIRPIFVDCLEGPAR